MLALASLSMIIIGCDDSSNGAGADGGGGASASDSGAEGGAGGAGGEGGMASADTDMDGIADADDKWSVSVVGNNITDEEVLGMGVPFAAATASSSANQVRSSSASRPPAPNASP